MTPSLDPHLLVRAGAIYVAAILTLVVWVWRRPSSPDLTAALLAFCWNLPALLLLHVGGRHFDWWRFDAHGGLMLEMPVDLYLAWAWLWGPLPALLFKRLPIVTVAVLALVFDLVLMPAAAPVLQLRSHWLVGEVVGLSTCLVPAQLLARWTARDTRLVARSILQMITFAGLVLVLLPVIAIHGSRTSWRNPLDLPIWQLALFVQVLAVPAAIGVSAVQEFVTRGSGTPVPFDPPRRLVTSGLYAYVRNPMQLSAVILLALLGVMLANLWVAAAGVMAHLYSIGLAGWDEEQDMRVRFGAAWTKYRADVARWWPRWRPWHDPAREPATLFASERCDMCREVGRWFERRGASGLVVTAAEAHPSPALTRLTYQPADGSRPARGVEALARALEHVHFGWAFTGACLRLPGVAWLAQLVVDASGGEPRALNSAVCASPPLKRR